MCLSLSRLDTIVKSVKLGGAGQLHGRHVPTVRDFRTNSRGPDSSLGAGAPKSRGSYPTPRRTFPLPDIYRVALYNAIIQISSQSVGVSRCAPRPRIAARRSIIVLDLRPLCSLYLSAVPPHPLAALFLPLAYRSLFPPESRCRVTRAASCDATLRYIPFHSLTRKRTKIYTRCPARLIAPNALPV